jgi:hypothetical protein
MSRMGSIFNRMTGVAARHNRALGEVKDWASVVERFLVGYGLMEDGSDLGLMLGNSGDAKFDLTGIAYTGRGLTARSGEIRDKRVAPLLAVMVNNVENIRRYLMTPSIQAENLAEKVAELRASFQTFRAVLAEIEYM